jgi:hypothetical protein
MCINMCDMQLMHRQWTLASRALQRQLESSQESTRQIAQNAGVNYYAVRRMRKRGLTRKTENAVKLCNYFKISAHGEVTFAEICGELEDAWDGSEAHSGLLIQLIRSTRNFKVSRNGRATISKGRPKARGGVRK